MRDISKGERLRNKNPESGGQKRRKYQSSDRQSVVSAAQEFLEKAARELLGDKKGGFKGPLQIDTSDDDLPVD